jgi:hypothetical protein
MVMMVGELRNALAGLRDETFTRAPLEASGRCGGPGERGQLFGGASGCGLRAMVWAKI